MSARSIAKRLTHLGIPTRADTQTHFAKKFGKCIWQGVTVMAILSNETYIGTWHFGKTKVIDNNNYREFRSKRTVSREIGKSSREEWIPVSVPAIIDNETFDLAQKRRSTNKKRMSGRAKHNYLMKGRLTCAKCGYALYGHTTNYKGYQHSYYICSGREQVIGLCDMSSISVDWVDSAVWNWVKDIIENTDNLRDSLQDTQTQLLQENRSLFERLSIIEERILEYQMQLSRLLDLYLSGELPKEVLTERKARTEDMLANLEKERNDLSEYIRSVNITDAQLSYLEAFGAKIREGIDGADFYTKRQIVELLDIHGKIAIENGEKVVYLKCLIEPTEDGDFSEVSMTQTF